MTLGMEQTNTFDTFVMDCWNDTVYYSGQEFPAGCFAAEILNFAGKVHDPLLERICTLTELVDQATSSEKDEALAVLTKTEPILRDAVSWIYTCPPFCYQKSQNEWQSFELATDRMQFEKDYEE